MQLYALDAEQQLVAARNALPQVNYFCLECYQTVRRRGGVHRHTHYYHLSPLSSCRLSGKSMEHLQVQYYIQERLPVGECSLEQRFPEINRIADLVWWNQKLIFEVQCSFITAQEIEKRNRDYFSIGFQVVWILHEKRYNQERVTDAEQYLRHHPFYFTNLDKQGQGAIYDQADLIQKNRRIFRQTPFAVNLEEPKRLQERTFAKVTPFLDTRLSHWPVHFAGDVLDHWQQGKYEEFLQTLLDKEKGLVEKKTLWCMLKRFLFYTLVRPYRLLFQSILESACH